MANSGKNGPEAHLRDVVRREVQKLLGDGGKSWKHVIPDNWPSDFLGAFNPLAVDPPPEGSGFGAGQGNWADNKRLVEVDTLIFWQTNYTVIQSTAAANWQHIVGNPDYQTSEDPLVQDDRLFSSIAVLPPQPGLGNHVRTGYTLVPAGQAYMFFSSFLDTAKISGGSMQLREYYEFK